MSVQYDETDAPFRAFPKLNKNRPGYVTQSRIRLTEFAEEYLEDDRFETRMIRALGETRVIGPKEVLESFEFYARTRRRMRSARMADLCCGHGLVGILYAAMQRSVEQVTLLDVRCTDGSQEILNAIISVAPWVEEKVKWSESPVDGMADHLEPGTTITGVHACGKLTDRCLEVAHLLGSRGVVMPCCYGPNQSGGPEVLTRMLDPWVVTDVDRTYRMEGLGYKMDWTYIPRMITPRNRVLVGIPKT